MPSAQGRVRVREESELSEAHNTVREACLSAAMRTIENEGIEALSLRKIARSLGVSHQAPYKHFASREHLLAEVVADAFASFADFLDQRVNASQVEDKLLAMGLAYIEFALSFPHKYRLMFSTTLPDASRHPVMLEKAAGGYVLLRECLAGLDYAKRPDVDEAVLDRDAMLILTLVHGLVSALSSDAMHTIPISPDTRKNAIAHTLARIGTVLEGAVPSSAEMARIQSAIDQALPQFGAAAL